MGDGFQALDTRLGHDVALKMLPKAVAGDSSRRARIQLEAHSSVAGIYLNIATFLPERTRRVGGA